VKCKVTHVKSQVVDFAKLFCPSLAGARSYRSLLPACAATRVRVGARQTNTLGARSSRQRQRRDIGATPKISAVTRVDPAKTREGTSGRSERQRATASDGLGVEVVLAFAGALGAVHGAIGPEHEERHVVGA
jgi:hypothetical protein